MLIEHDGKRIDTEREIRRKSDYAPVRYVGSLKDERHIFEWGQGCWDVYPSDRALLKFENVPQTHERFINIYDDNSCGCAHETKEMADANAKSIGQEHRRIDCIRITWQN